VAEKHPGEDNLVKGRFARIPKEEHLEISRKGGLAYGEKRRKAKLLRQMAFDLLNTEIPTQDEVRQMLVDRGLDTTYGDGMLLTMILRAIAGDVDAARFVRDTSGQRPAEQVELGNVDGLPFMRKDLKELSDEELLRLMSEAKEAKDEEA